MTEPADAIAARRKLTNKLIAGKVAARLTPFFDPRVTLIAGDGSVLMGAAEVIAAFDAQFRDPDFIAYVRTAESITIDSAGLRAAEQGRWVGSWRGAPEQSGPYMATWRKVTGQWVIENELFVTLQRGD
ncbi:MULTISPECIES: nuclear transport factor 2 family protein [unclassified Caulobacter]|uniref:nuclear transport factor 2 family protein n=1 Tax=unclassified Caulobacter TaxID=2648921 RepID=UPI000D37F94A|nr:MULTISPECIES: nuclear transport factor 2 family protein [unclassified Caulobacter]PTS84559.1 DUF4440 domain-containing protein [Caulobacter sp. HMWF009]PTT08665.1 DUF4440 domain-containing protein [Caulobacter sp. HMWF025]